MKKYVWRILFKWKDGLKLEGKLPRTSDTRQDARARVRDLRNIYSKKEVSFKIVKEPIV